MVLTLNTIDVPKTRAGLAYHDPLAFWTAKIQVSGKWVQIGVATFVRTW